MARREITITAPPMNYMATADILLAVVEATDIRPGAYKVLVDEITGMALMADKALQAGLGIREVHVQPKTTKAHQRAS